MWNFLAAVLVLASTPMASADTECTAADKSAWQNESSFRAEKKAEGYRITKFRVTPGNCYEIYGYDARQRRVEHYFNPVDGSLVMDEQVSQL